MMTQNRDSLTCRLSRGGMEGIGAYAGVLQASMDEKFAPGAIGDHGAIRSPCHAYGMEGEKLRIGTVNVGTSRGREV